MNPNNHKLDYNFHSTLIPVRIDVSSEDKNARIVDTLLIDPTCWPIPLYVPLQESVEKNIREYAYMVLSDAEVAGMGRTVRHFTGRVDLWTHELQAQAEDQIRPQIWDIVHQQIIVSYNDKSNNNQKPIPISIRMILYGIQIHEDFLWDPSVPLTPMEFAQQMADEFNLPPEAVVSITICILEQLYGLVMDPSEDLLVEATNDATDPKPRGAWMLDTKEALAMTNQIVSQHRPI